MAELESLIAHLGLGGGYLLLGQSWGGMLGAEFATLRPAGLRRLVIADSPASMALWIAETGRMRAALPIEVQAALSHQERLAPPRIPTTRPRPMYSTPAMSAGLIRCPIPWREAFGRWRKMRMSTT